jgi:cysteine desulfurase
MLDDDGISASTRSACATGSLRASHVLLSLGLSHADAQGTLVVSFGVDNTDEDITAFLASLKNVVNTLREISPLYKKTYGAN